MVNLDELTARGRRAYELGRLRAAARAAPIIVPVVALCEWESQRTGTCSCLGLLLLALALWFRWRSRRGADSVTAGLLAGGVPLAVALVVGRLAPGACAGAGWVSACTALCALAGVAGGFWMGRRVASGAPTAAGWTLAGAMAALAASLGCVGLGAGALGAALGAAAGVILGGAGAALAAARAR
jgi:hypothetical protein